jgi:drug/metabolite transporter (DMT)-like permease
MTTKSRIGAEDWVLLLLLSVLWGGSFLFGRVAVAALPPFTIVAARLCLASATLAVVLALTGMGLPRGGRFWRAAFGMGVLNNAIPFCLIVWGQKELGAGIASVLNATTPLFTVLLAHGLTSDEKLSAAKLFGIALGLGGVVVLLGFDPAATATSLWASLACLTAAVSYGFANIFGRRFRAMGVRPLHTAFGQVTASSSLLVPLSLVFDRPWTLDPPGLAPVGSVIALGLFCTALAYVMFFRVLERAGATAISLVTFMIPPSAILLGIVFLGERLGPSHIAGTALIGLGLAAVDGRLFKWAATALASDQR